MSRKKTSFALALIFALSLSACDKCGGIQDIRVPSAPHACKDDAAR